MSPTYPMHGFTRPVRSTHPLGNAFAQQRERQRLSDLTAYQRDMAAQRYHAAYHYHAASHQETTHRHRALTPDGRQDYHANAESPRAFGRPVSSWSFVNNNNNNNNNTFQGTLQSSPRPESFPGYDPATAHIALTDFLLPVHDPLLDGITEETDDPGVDYSELKRVLDQAHFEIMSKRDCDAAFPQASPSSELTRTRRADRAQQALQDLASNYNMNLRTRLNQQALPHSGDPSFKSNVSHRTDRNPTDLVNPGNLSSECNMDLRTGLSQQALPRPGDPSAESNVSRRTDRNFSTPLRFDENSAEFTPRRIEHNQPTFLPPGAQSANSTPHHTNRINNDLLRPGDLSSDHRNHEFNQPIIGRSGIKSAMSAGSESELVVPSRLDRDLPALPRPDDPSTNITLPQRIDSIQPTLARSGIQFPESESGVPHRVERNQPSLVRPDSEVSEVMMPRHTPPSRFAALTSQHTAPMPAHLSTVTGRTNATAQNHYVKKAAGNDAMVMSTGPLIPARDGSYAATGMPRTVQGRQINSMMAQLDCSSPITAVPTVLSSSAAVFAPVSDQYTIDQLIKRMDRLQMKQDADRKLIGELMEAQKAGREEIEALKGGMGGKEVEREIGDGWYTSN